MKFTCKNTETVFDTSNYLNTFVDEYTGELNPNRKVLDRRIRKLWFRSVYPNAVIKHKVDITSLLDKITDASAEQLDALKEAAKEGKAALAFVQIVDNSDVIAENFALRRASYDGEDSSNAFEYYTEAALNAALDRCLIDLGFVVPEEIEFAPNPFEGEDEVNNNSSNSSKPTVKKTRGPKKNVVSDSQRAIADIEAMIDSDSMNTEVTESSNAPCYDKSSPVEEIEKLMSISDARAYVFTCNGKYKGKTVGDVYESDKDKNGHSNALSWYAERFVGKDNILVAACHIVNK